MSNLQPAPYDSDQRPGAAWKPCLVLALLLGAACRNAPVPAGDEQAVGLQRPNIVLILLDDLDTGSLAAMPQVQRLLVDQGTRFDRHFVSVPLCCPSRASIFTGLYGHNHGVWTNGVPDGGFPRYRERGHEQSNLAPWLDAAGYRTLLAGKYLNGYPAGEAETYVPPGWDDWFALLADRRGGYNNYTVNDNGRTIRLDEYQTDRLAARARAFVADAEARDDQPFFIFLSLAAPHAPSIPAPRHAALFEGARAPRTPSYNEADVSDKPRWLRRVPRLNFRQRARLDRVYRRRLQTLAAVDELVEGLLDTLQQHGELTQTFVFFTSDNGYLQGQHRFPSGKNAPYEEAIRVPLLVRGPGVPAGARREHLISNVDYAPTFLELAAAPQPRGLNGRSLLPLLQSGPLGLDAWRQELLIEHYRTGDPFFIPDYAGLRTQHEVYFEYATGDVELYDLRQDPHQLASRHAEAPPQRLRELSQRLETRRRCRGADCR